MNMDTLEIDEITTEYSEYPKVMKKKNEDGSYRYIDAESKKDEDKAVLAGWESNATGSKESFENKIKEVTLYGAPDEYKPQQYPKWIESLGRSVDSKEEEDRYLGAVAAPTNESKSLSKVKA